MIFFSWNMPFNVYPLNIIISDGVHFLQRKIYTCRRVVLETWSEFVPCSVIATCSSDNHSTDAKPFTHILSLLDKKYNSKEKSSAKQFCQSKQSHTDQWVVMKHHKRKQKKFN